MLPANEMKWQVVGKKSPYISVGNDEGVFHWKRLPTKEANAIAIFRLCSTNKEFEQHCKYEYRSIAKLLSDLTKELKKSNIVFKYLNYMGMWSDISKHWIDYSWTEMDSYVKAGQSYLFVDDIDVLRALKSGKLNINHSINKSDVKAVKEAFKAVGFTVATISSKSKICIKLKPSFLNKNKKLPPRVSSKLPSRKSMGRELRMLWWER